MLRYLTVKARHSQKKETAKSHTTNGSPPCTNLTQTEVRWADDDDNRNSSTDLTSLFQNSPSSSSSACSSPGNPPGRSSPRAEAKGDAPAESKRHAGSPQLATQPSSSPPSADNTLSGRKSSIEEELDGIFAILDREKGDASGTPKVCGDGAGGGGSRRRRRRRLRERGGAVGGDGDGGGGVAARKRIGRGAVGRRRRSVGYDGWSGGRRGAAVRGSMLEEHGDGQDGAENDGSTGGESYFETLLQELDSHVGGSPPNDGAVSSAAAAAGPHQDSIVAAAHTDGKPAEKSTTDLCKEASLQPPTPNTSRGIQTDGPPKAEHLTPHTTVPSAPQDDTKQRLHLHKHTAKHPFNAKQTLSKNIPLIPQRTQNTLSKGASTNNRPQSTIITTNTSTTKDAAAASLINKDVPPILTTNNPANNTTKDQAVSDDIFESIDFDDDVFAAVDAAVNARLSMQSTQTLTETTVDKSLPSLRNTGTLTARPPSQQQPSRLPPQKYPSRNNSLPSNTQSGRLPEKSRHDNTTSSNMDTDSRRGHVLQRTTTLQTCNTSLTSRSCTRNRTNIATDTHSRPPATTNIIGREIICLDDDDHHVENTVANTTATLLQKRKSSSSNPSFNYPKRTNLSVNPSHPIHPHPYQPPCPIQTTAHILPPINPSTTTTTTAAVTITDPIPTTANTPMPPNDSSNADDYGDLPMLDFDEIDRLIAQRGSTANGTTTGIRGDSDNAMNAETLPKVVTPPNANCEGGPKQGHGPEVISFTRYRVRSVVENVSAFTKTLGVSVWTLHDQDNDNDFRHGNNSTHESPQLGKDTGGDEMRQVGEIHLQGEWFHSRCDVGDTIHVVSLHGRKRTDPAVLPMTLHTLPDGDDDLVMVIHPDVLVTPTSVSDTVSCTRRAALNIRLGSSGLTSRAALFGVMRHELFEKCLLHNNFTRPFVDQQASLIVRDHAESMIGCGLYHEREAIPEVCRVLPQIQSFASMYLSLNNGTNNSYTPHTCNKLDGHGISPSIRMSARSIFATEDAATSPELGLKGFVDVTIEAVADATPSDQTSSYLAPRGMVTNGHNHQHHQHQHHQHQHQHAPQMRSFMGIELKTGHNQTPQNAHMAQLSLYTLMLNARHGSAIVHSLPHHHHYVNDNPPPPPSSSSPHNTHSPIDHNNVATNGEVASAGGGMLLYLNDKAWNAVHVKPTMNELKSLVNQRNVVATDIRTATRPRGVLLDYENDHGHHSDGESQRSNNNNKEKRITILPAPPTSLPELLNSSHSCQRCYSNRECMMNNAVATMNNNTSSISSGNHKKNPHADILHHYTGQLDNTELQYFRDWDRLIDLEAHVQGNDITKAWLIPSGKREITTGRTISSLILRGGVNDGRDYDHGNGHAMALSDSDTLRQDSTDGIDRDDKYQHTITLTRSPDSKFKTPLNSLKLEIGSRLILSTDHTSIQTAQRDDDGWFECRTANNANSSSPSMLLRSKKRFQQMNILKGVTKHINATDISIGVNAGDLKKLLHFVQICSTQQRHKQSDIRHPSSTSNVAIMNTEPDKLLFRLDKEEYTGGAKVLRQNLLNLFTADVPTYSPPTTRSNNNNNNNHDKVQANIERIFTKRLPQLRRAIIHLNTPRFEQKLAPLFHPSSRKGNNNLSHHGRIEIDGCELFELSKEFALLNKDQKAAVIKTISAKDYSLIQGFPGTGKTTVICFVARLLAARGKRVLVTSYTHGAVDNLMLKLMNCGVGKSRSGRGKVNADLLRIGPKGSCHPDLHQILASRIASSLYHNDTTNNHDPHGAEHNTPTTTTKPSAESLHRVLSTAKIVGVSALTIPRSPLLVGQHFDYVIVDEAGQISQPAIIGTLMAADSFILVGDHEQLPPLVQSAVAEEAGYNVSMLKRLAEKHPSAIAQLTLQYRMNEDICSVCNEVVYKGKLKIATPAVSSSKIKLSKYPGALRTLLTSATLGGLGWLVPVLNPARSVVFVNTDAIGSTAASTFQGLEVSHRIGGDGGGVVNEVELGITRVIVEGLTVCGIEPTAVGVICPYRSQVTKLNEDASLSCVKKLGLEISTIDRYQGRDKDAIVLSLVRSNAHGKAGRLLEDYRRLNVALSRAKQKLVIVGSFYTLSNGSSVLKPILTGMKVKGWIETLPQNALSLYG